jgi:hypothetical protein
MYSEPIQRRRESALHGNREREEKSASWPQGQAEKVYLAIKDGRVEQLSEIYCSAKNEKQEDAETT